MFKPYTGVTTAILVFTKTGTGGTEKVWFYEMKADGYSLNDKREILGTPDDNEPELALLRTIKHEENKRTNLLPFKEEVTFSFEATKEHIWRTTT